MNASLEVGAIREHDSRFLVGGHLAYGHKLSARDGALFSKANHEELELLSSKLNMAVLDAIFLYVEKQMQILHTYLEDINICLFFGQRQNEVAARSI